MRFGVIYDANVFYPAPLRDVLMQLALTGLYKAWWTDEIHEEWKRNLLKNRTDISEERLNRTIESINSAVPDCLVNGYEDLVPCINLPDVNDCHVLAAAIKSHSQVIVTFNLKDFPISALDQYGIEAQHPDVFLMHLLDLHKGAVITALRMVRSRLKNPPKTAEEYLQTLESQGLIKFSAAVEEFIDSI